MDVIVDLRKDSPRFLQHLSIELSAENKKMIYIPEGIAHGFQTLEDNSELIYHHTEFYTPEADSGLRYDDPKLDIMWNQDAITVSEKDMRHKLLDNNFKGF